MPRFSGQNKKRINPRYFLNETMDPRIAAMMTLRPGAQVTLQTGEVAEIVDVIDPGQTYEVAIDGGDEERTITIYDIDMDQLRAPGDLREDQDIQVGDDVKYEGEVYQVKDIEGDKVDLERNVKDDAGGHSQSEYGVPMSSVEPV
jgi:preprotein translocase subunit YajC